MTKDCLTSSSLQVDSNGRKIWSAACISYKMKGGTWCIYKRCEESIYRADGPAVWHVIGSLGWTSEDEANNRNRI